MVGRSYPLILSTICSGKGFFLMSDKLSKEELKKLRIKNLNRKGRTIGSKNKVTETKIMTMIEHFLRDKDQEKINIKRKAQELDHVVNDISGNQKELELETTRIDLNQVNKIENIAQIKPSLEDTELKNNTQTESKKKDWIDDLFD